MLTYIFIEDVLLIFYPLKWSHYYSLLQLKQKKTTKTRAVVNVLQSTNHFNDEAKQFNNSIPKGGRVTVTFLCWPFCPFLSQTHLANTYSSLLGKLQCYYSSTLCT